MYTRQQILEAAGKFIGLPFLHQGRSATEGVDCVGLLVLLGREIGYPEIHDVEGYRRIPRPEVIKSVLALNCDEISLDEVREGDIFFMRYGGRIPRHAAICYESGADGSILHASRDGVCVESIKHFPKNWFISAYRVRDLID